MNMSVFRFKQFEVENSASALKVGTDAVLLGAVVSLGWVNPEARAEAEMPEEAGTPGPAGKPEEAENPELAEKPERIDAPLKILDVGTGTGVIALMLAQRLAKKNGSGEATHSQNSDGDVVRSATFHIDAIDIDGPSAEEAKLNFSRSPWAEHMVAHHFGLADWDNGPYDLIISNPPYFENSLRNPDARESTARHADTLSYRELCEYAVTGPRTDAGGQTTSRTHLAPADRLPGGLSPDGRLAMILPAEQETDLRRTAASFGLYPARIVRIRTTGRKPPKRIVVELSRASGPAAEEELVIQKDGEFTPEYRSYVHPFLLYL